MVKAWKKHKDEACDYYEIHEDSMEIINKTMPEETELEDLADCLRFSEILQESVFCLCFSKQRYVYATLRKH